MQNVVKQAAARAGVTVSPHALRRGWCVQFMTDGGAETACMEIAGWTSPMMIPATSPTPAPRPPRPSFDRVAARQTGRAANSGPCGRSANPHYGCACKSVSDSLDSLSLALGTAKNEATPAR